MDDISYFLKEDLQDKGDITTDGLFSDEVVHGIIVAKEDCVLAGFDEARHVFSIKDASVDSKYRDGNHIDKSAVIADIHGPVRGVLSAERLALNILGRMSGIATQTKKIVDLCTPLNPSIEIAATRKTTPGFRKYEKKAVVVGGGVSHRMGLYDAIMIKDNHLKLVGSVEEAIVRLREKYGDMPVEIEIESKKDAISAAHLGVDVIMIDNNPPDKALALVEVIKAIDSSIIIELSGGITMENIREYASFSDRISLGMLTHTVKNVDFSLELL